ncbi:MAG: hypothetical protein ACFFD3_09715, partial [Candidatus Thorarchaeota archaeon]
AEAWMNLAKGPSNLCFFHLEPSCTIQNMRNSTIIKVKGTRNTVNQNIIGFLPVHLSGIECLQPIKATVAVIHKFEI